MKRYTRYIQVPAVIDDKVRLPHTKDERDNNHFPVIGRIVEINGNVVTAEIIPDGYNSIFPISYIRKLALCSDAKGKRRIAIVDEPTLGEAEVDSRDFIIISTKKDIVVRLKK